MGCIKDLSNSTWGGSSHLNESNDEKAHDEDDYYFSIVKTLIGNDINSSKYL